MTLCFFIEWWSLESSVWLLLWALWRKMREMCCCGAKGAAGGRGGASEGWWVRSSALLTPLFCLSWQRLELFPKEEDNKHSWKINILSDYFSSFLSPSHSRIHTHTRGSRIPNISFWSFYWLKKTDILWKPIALFSPITGFSLQNFFCIHLLFCHFSLSIAIIRMRKSVFPEVKIPQLWQAADSGERSKDNTEASSLWWLPVPFPNRSCKLYIFLCFCTATKLGRSLQLLPIHSFNSWLNRVRYPSLVLSYLLCLNLLFDGAPSYQRLLTNS